MSTQLSFVGDWLPRKPSGQSVGDRGCVISNLECAFEDGDVDSGKAYTSVLPRLCLEHVATGGFAALSVANNHVNDAVNFRETYAELTSRFPGIQFFGTTSKPYAVIEQSNNRTIVIGCLEPCRSRSDFIFKQEDVAALIRKLRSSQLQPSISTLIFVYPHWGKEGEYTRWPSPRQKKLARRWIDAGADGVFGSHSHVFQGMEEYKGKPIYYSLGNFFFPHPESKLYEGTDVGLCVEIDNGYVDERFVRNGVLIEDASEVRHLKELIKSIGEPLKNWTTWKWARAVGPFNLKKNTASWKIRLRKNFVKTLPTFLVWQILPKTLLFRAAAYMI